MQPTRRSMPRIKKRVLPTMIVILAIAMAGLVIAPGTSAYPAAPEAKDAPSAPLSAVIDFSQCQNDAPPSTNLGCSEWINGILNPNNSHYTENNSVPQRFVFNVTGTAGVTHTLQFKHQARKGQAHAYDSHTSFDLTQTQAGSVRCLGLAANLAGLCS